MSNYEGRNAEQREAEQIARRKASQGFVASTFEAVVHANLPKREAASITARAQRVQAREFRSHANHYEQADDLRTARAARRVAFDLDDAASASKEPHRRPGVGQRHQRMQQGKQGRS